MAKLFAALPTTAANGPGTAVDVSNLGASKTIVVEGNGSGLFEPYVLIEVSNDDAAAVWSPVFQFLRPGSKDVVVACRFMRATVKNYRQGGAPTVNVGASDDGASFATLDAPATNGNGAGVDVSSLPAFKTVQVSGSYKGSVNIEVSNDGGATYSQVLSFRSGQGSGIRSAVIYAEYMRVSRSGVQPRETPGTPVVDIGASDPGDAGGGGGGGGGTQYVFVYRPGDTQSGNVYTDWEDLVTAVDAVEGQRIVEFDNVNEAITIPAGTWNMSDVVWQGVPSNMTAAYPVVVDLEDGVSLPGLRTIRNLKLRAASETTPPIELGDADVLDLDGATLSGGLGWPVVGMSVGAKSMQVRLSNGAALDAEGTAFAVTGNSYEVVMDASSTVSADALSGTNVTVRLDGSSNFNGDQNVSDLTVVGNPGRYLVDTDEQSPALGVADIVDASGGPQVVFLPNAAASEGGFLVVKKSDNTENAITITPDGGDSIDGAPTLDITTPLEAIVLLSDGANTWRVLSSYKRSATKIGTVASTATEAPIVEIGPLAGLWRKNDVVQVSLQIQSDDASLVVSLLQGGSPPAGSPPFALSSTTVWTGQITIAMVSDTEAVMFGSLSTDASGYIIETNTGAPPTPFTVDPAQSFALVGSAGGASFTLNGYAVAQAQG